MTDANNANLMRMTRTKRIRKVLTQGFFERDTETVARELLGKWLVRKYSARSTDSINSPRASSGQSKEIAEMITDVEVYDGSSDKGSHASHGKTERNKVMFGPAGRWYPYFTYGMHWLLNIVTREEKYPAAILIRGVRGISGPARVTKFFKIDGKFYGKPAERGSGLWIEDRGIKIGKKRIMRSARVGIDYAGPYWKKRKLRFFLKIEK